MSAARVVVLGAGPAGLAAATHLLEHGRGRVSVRLLNMGHHLGGKAASYVDARGRKSEHGWHMVLGFYARMRKLMRSAGVDVARTLSSMGGQSHAYESWDGRIHTLDGSGGRLSVAGKFLGYDGLPLAERLAFGRCLTQAYAIATSAEDARRHDDICWDTWAIEHGLRPHITRYSLFRLFREAFFNFPEPISAYHVLCTLRLMSTSEDAEAFVCRGPFSERIWDPIGRHIERLGGKIEPYSMVTDFVYDGPRVRGLRVARPDPAGHDSGMSPWKTRQIPEAQGSARVDEQFDWVISTLPHAVLATLNARDQRFWSSPYFRRITHLRSASTIAMTVRTRRPVGRFQGPVFGLPAPLGICVDMTRHLDETRGSPGSFLSFVGQEAGFEAWSDEQIVSFTLDNFARAPGFGDVRAAGIAELEIHRNRADFERIFLCEPGVQQFRPGPLTPFRNLFLAGDWVTNEVDLVCMEGAIASGLEAAKQVLGRVGQS